MSAEYNLYIQEHVDNCLKALDWLKDNIGQTLNSYGINEYFAFTHDTSKYSDEEYEAYDAYFYGGNRSYSVVRDFNYAWLHHIHVNPHHWQHWVLVNDDAEEGSVALEMPIEDVIEMICDWWSFSWKNGNLMEIFNWYDSHKGRMILHKNTRRIVEDILDEIRKKLEENTNEE